MENKKIALATINDIETDKNVDALSMITKIDLKLTNSKNGNSTKIRNINFEDSLRMNDEQIKVKEAVFMLNNMENFNYSISYTEVQDIRNDLRLFAINNYHEKKYTDCLIHSIHSYMIGKKYYSKYFGFYITGDMSTELILICKCYVLVENFEEGKKYLHELKFLIDNTLLYIHKMGILDDQQQKKEEDLNNTSKMNNLGSNYEEPIIQCGIEVLSNILYIFGDLLSLYKQNEEAETYFLKYLYMIEKCFNADSLNYSDALNDVCSYYIKIRDYSKALPICQQILEIRKKFFGDYNSENPSEIIADCYCNWGLLLRLSGNSLESLHKYLIAVDMRMRIHKTRQTVQVQDILLSFAIIMQQLNNFRMSLQLYKEVYSFYKNYYGPDDINTKVVFKLIEELEKDVMKETNKNGKREPSHNLENYMTSINDKLRKDNKIEKNWNSLNENLQNMSKKSDVDPHFVEDFMNERVLINTKNIPSKNLSNKKTFISLEGKLKYNNLSYSSIDAYKYMQSNKDFEILKSSFFITSSINRIKSLYADSWKSTLIPSTYILPFVETKMVDNNLEKYSQCKDFQNAIIYKRKILPIVNIPLIERGYVKLDNDQPIMTCNDDAKILLSEWNIKEPFVDSKGNVISKYEDLDNEFNMFLSILDENNEIMLGFYNNPLLVPNPAIYHCLILGDPYYFHRYNQVNNLYSFDNLNTINKNKFYNHNKFLGSTNTNRDNVNSYNKNSNDSMRNRNQSKIRTKSFGQKEKNSLLRAESKKSTENKNSINDEAINKEHSTKPNEMHNRSTSKVLSKSLKSIKKKSEVKSGMNELIEGEASKDEQSDSKKDDQNDDQSEYKKKESTNEMNELNEFVKNIKSKEKREVTKLSNIFSGNKKEPRKKVPIKKVHILRNKNNSSSTVFSKQKYALKDTGKLSTFFPRNTEKIKLIGYDNANQSDKLERTLRKIRLKKEPVLKSSIVHNIRMDLHSNVNMIEQDIDNLKREIYYENFPSSSYTSSTHLSSPNESDTNTSYNEYSKFKKKGKYSSKKHAKGTIRSDANDNSINERDNNMENNNDITTDNSNENVSLREVSNHRNSFYSQGSENDDEDVIDLCKIFNVNQSHKVSSNSFNGKSLTDKKDNSESYISSYSMEYVNNHLSHPSDENHRSYLSSMNRINENFVPINSSKNNERTIFEKDFQRSSSHNSDNQNDAIKKLSKCSEFHMKDKINNIKSVNKTDILFKFRLNQECSLTNENIFSDSDISQSELYANPLGTYHELSSKGHSINENQTKAKKLGDQKMFDTSDDRDVSVYSSFHENNKHVMNTPKNEVNKISNHYTKKNLCVSNHNKDILKNKKHSNMNKTNEEFILSENEEFYNEMILTESKIDSQISYISETAKNCHNANKKDTVHSNVGDEINYSNKIHNDGKFYQPNEETFSESTKNEELYDMDKECFTDNIYLRSNSIEELDSNLITQKYITNNFEKGINTEEKLSISGSIATDSLEYEMDNISSNISYNNKMKKTQSNKKYLSQNEADIILTKTHDGYSNKNIVHYNKYDNNNNYTIKKEAKHENMVGEELSSNLSNSSAHSILTMYNDNNEMQECDINYDPSFNANVESYNDGNHVKEKKKKVATFLHSNKQTRISKLFSFFSRKKKKKKKKSTKLSTFNELIKNQNENLNDGDKYKNFPSNPFSSISIKKEESKDISVTNSIIKRKGGKKHLFMSVSLHGMEKPKQNIKPKGLGLKKMLMMKKGIFSKNNFIEKKESLSKNSNHSKSEEKETKSPINISSKEDASDGEFEKKTIDKEDEDKGAEIKDIQVEKESSEDITNSEEQKEEKMKTSEKSENKFPKKMSPLNAPKKTILKKISPKIVPKIVVNKAPAIKERNNMKKNDDVKYEVKTVKNINEKLAFDILRKIKYCKIGFEPDEILGTLPTVHLLNEDKILLAIVPWQLDLTSFSLAKSSVEEETIKKIGLLHRKFDLSLDERKNQLINETRLLTGEGLKELGFTSTVSTGKAVVPDISLLSGIDTNALKNAYKIEKKSEPKEKTPTTKKESPKMAPKEKGGKKGAPKFMKGPPKGAKAGPVIGKGKGKISKIKQAKDEGKTKRFFWEALFEDDIPGTLFEDKKELISKIAIEKENVEKCFAKAVSKKEEGGELKIKKPKIIQLLPDSKREYNMSIALSKFNNYTFKEIRDAVMDLNPKILNIDNTEVLMQYVPTPEEFEIVKEYILSNGDLNLVDKPEQYVAALMGVPLLKQRLESHYFALSFKENYENTLNPLENILEACEAVKNSTNLFTILFTILNVGNTLNYGDPQRGNAFGFKLTTLAKLNDIRSTTKPVKTLLQYICEIIYQKDADILDIIEELRSIEKVTKTDKQIIDSILQKLKLGSNKIKNILDLAKKNPDDPLYDALKEFYFSVEPKIEELDTFYNQTFAVFKEIALYLGYKEKEVGNIQVQDFFKELWKFVQSIEFNRKTIKEVTLKELKKKEKELENAKKGAVLSKKQNFVIVKKQEKEPKTKLEKKTFKIF
ncbi:hypothetical protein, conserved [Plasmodium gonderi]|uniref:FH2 domain-containing protein n=1 Tax=Plasmodium gonderi TaxID=77519 RepID=A0A1Y1JKD0_PLAGO|nr:hypothetical protein, conserved [Plasmodium gonderi]GAW81252.1 hypothetical protein, conserved [Plasmodium gonderi]